MGGGGGGGGGLMMTGGGGGGGGGAGADAPPLNKSPIAGSTAGRRFVSRGARAARKGIPSGSPKPSTS